MFLRYCKEVGWIFPFENIVIACERPIVKWNDAGEIHSESQPAIEFKDFRVWAIDGVVVPEKVVTNPASQTIEEIQSENNEEVRRVRISRYGWTNYLREIMQVIKKMADEQLEDDSIDSNAFGLLVGEGDNLPHPSADREMLHWEEWENKDGEDIDAAAESGIWEEE